ncbi:MULTISPECIES: amino acid adenylation domain-containing protein [unclassified Nostoc]|uniref:amino acid adenylation domain-containing protein n=1 Tax=unclassified Nostoc TaxID=2593658 RepID=UPI00261266D3|nr:amino acid adenylation domain-containing protein [Nostoc sp. S13]MDF5736629.1 amino acid adenylation domain-containing protein [Nostoc sp. S13]
MKLNQFLSELSKQGVKLWVDGDELRIRAPKGVLTQTQRELLALHKTELVMLLRSNMSVSDIDLPLVRVSRELDLPVSFAQQRMLFFYQLDRNNPFYNESFQFRINGALSIAALEQSINEIIHRHEALRTIFPTVDGFAVQQIIPTLTINIPVVDLQGLKEAEIQQIVTEEARQPFDLGKDPLLRVTLLRLGLETHLLILTIHHIIIDGWSMGIFIKELSALYQAFTTGSPNPLPELTIQYADFALWQRKWLTEELQQRQLNYWKQQLADAPPLLELSTDYPRPSVQTFSGAIKEFQLNSNLTAQLKTLSQQSGTTLFMTLLAAFAILLHRYSSQDDICIGSPFSNRNRTEIESLIGFFVNNLVLRTQIKENPSFSKFLTQVQSVVLDAHTHQEVPFEQVVEALQPERSLGYNPLFQVMFVLENFSLDTLELPGITLTPELVERGTAQFDLSLSIWATQKGLMGSWEYNSDLFKADTIARMTLHFQTLLEAIVAAPDQRVGELPLLTEKEQHQLLVEWNNTQTDYPNNKCIHQLFEQQVQRTPNAVAVEEGTQKLTYEQLNTHANKIAHYLQTLGVEPEVLVGICVERSLLMVVGLLGILKAGGAYVPLDPAYPSERLAYMLSDSGVKVLLTQQKLADILPQSQAKLICLDSDWQALDTIRLENPVTGVKPNNLAYVIYTSGSTGQPKGVMICHQSVVNYVAAKKVAYGMNSSDSEALLPNADRILQFSSISFDGAVEQIFICLSWGAPLVLRSDEMLSYFRIFLQKCQEWQVTVLILPTAYWHQLVSEIAATQESLPASVRLVSVGGQAVLPEKLKLWLEYVQQKQQGHQLEKPPLLMNGYGPTEATVEATICNLSELVLEETQLQVPIGCPLANVQTYILDQYLQSVPIGVPGELHIGGVGLARGYLNRPDLTAEKFIPNPFQKSEPLYKTGDKARYLPDGNIEFLGRIDNQVKIRGFRIELGEIETVITAHPQVEDAVVIDSQDNLDNKRLVAYVVTREHSSILNQLRDFLKQKLPNYMMPSAFVFLDALPLTTNCKVDRRALRALDVESSDSTGFVPPRDAVEQQLQKIWAEVLQLSTVGIGDKFFELGGHSLLAMRLMAMIEQHFGKNLPLATLFKCPTIEQLASCLRSETNSLTWSPLVAIQSNGDKRPFFCVPGVGGNIIYLYDLARHLGSDQPFYGLQALGLDGESHPHTRVEDIATYYIQAIQTVQPEGPYLLGGHSFGGQVAFEMATQLQLLGHSVALLAMIDAVSPILSKKLIRVDEDDAALIADFASFIEYTFSLNLEVFKEALPNLTAEEQLHYLKERLIRVNLLPLDAGIMSVRGLVEVYKANNQASSLYMPPQVQLSRIALFRAQEVDVLEDVNRSLTQILKEPALGWKEFSTNVEVHVVTGNHMTMMQQPHVQVLATQLRAYLE